MKTYYLIFIPFFLFIAYSCEDKTPQEQFNEFETLYIKGQYSNARKSIDKLIAIDTTSALLYNARGLSSLKLKQYETAIIDFSNALKIENENILALTKRGEAKSMKKSYPEAIEDFKRAIVLKGFKPAPDTIFSYKTKNVELFIDPLLFDIVYLRGKAYYDIFELYLAYDDFNLCIEASLNASIDSKFDKIPECYYWRGHTFKRMNEIKRACVDLNIAAESGITQAVKDLEEICQ